MPPIRLSQRLSRVPPSFLGELFRVSNDPSVISFAGGLPDAALIDLPGLSRAAGEVLATEGRIALQYTTTDGYRPLREYIARRYQQRLGLPADAADIQIVNGSQQCLDLIGKILIDPGDRVGIERPGYLGAIEAFSFYEPELHGVPLGEDGPDPDALRTLVTGAYPKFFYGIPNSQNPSGQTYSDDRRREIGEILDDSGVLFYEDDAFGELFFDGRPRVPVKKYLPDQSVMSGSFSKIVAPGMRIGWIWAPPAILTAFNAAKQAADLHSNLFSQLVLHRYLSSSDLDTHTRHVSAIYGQRCRLMCEMMDDCFPEGARHTTPEGGMFLVATLPPGLSSMDVFRQGVSHGVAVMPGVPFYSDGGGGDTIRLNFSNAGEDAITCGMERLAQVLREMR